MPISQIINNHVFMFPESGGQVSGNDMTYVRF